jgi:UDP-glucose 4-epimerase
MAELGIGKVAVFGGSGKLGRALIQHFLDRGVEVAALIHQRPLGLVDDRLEVVRGDITRREDVAAAIGEADAVLSLATTKEDPDTFFDVSLRGTFHVLDVCRERGSVKQVLLAGGDAAVGIWFYPHPEPIDESHPLMAYPGYYAFSKVLEEVMANQYHIQYGLPVTILRSSWIFEKDDILNHLSLRNRNPAEKGHGWDEYLTEEHLRILNAGENRIPILVNAEGQPYRRHIVHLEDVVQAFDLALGNPAALGETFHIAAPAAFQYDEAAQYLSGKTGTPTCTVVAAGYHSFEINIGKAQRVLGYKPYYTIHSIIDAALEWERQNPPPGGPS